MSRVDEVLRTAESLEPDDRLRLIARLCDVVAARPLGGTECRPIGRDPAPVGGWRCRSCPRIALGFTPVAESPVARAAAQAVCRDAPVRSGHHLCGDGGVFDSLRVNDPARIPAILENVLRRTNSRRWSWAGIVGADHRRETHFGVRGSGNSLAFFADSLVGVSRILHLPLNRFRVCFQWTCLRCRNGLHGRRAGRRRIPRRGRVAQALWSKSG